MKLVIQIPCLNEEQTLPITLDGLPKSVPGIDVIEVLVIDDGSRDRTVEIAQAYGAHVVRHNHNRGLAHAFQTGLNAALAMGADIIVNTDADNQYPGSNIPALVTPVLERHADIAIGDRNIDTIAYFSPIKKKLQKFGSWVVSKSSGVRVADAPSGFRAYSREAALRINVITGYTYTLETIFQAGNNNLVVASVPITVNPVQLRESRLVKGIWNYVKRQGASIVRLYATYEPLKTFTYASIPFLAIGLFMLGRWFILNYAWNETGIRHLQSGIVSILAIFIGALLFMIGLMADLISANRRLTEETLYRVKRMEMELADGQAKAKKEDDTEALLTETRALLRDLAASRPTNGHSRASLSVDASLEPARNHVK